MVDVLRLNGGIPTEIDDPECTHVVSMSNVKIAPKCFQYLIFNGLCGMLFNRILVNN